MILVFVEVSAAGDNATSGANEVSLETVTFARTLAERLGGPVHAVVVGALPEKVADEITAELGAYGVAQLHHATGAAFDAYGGAVWATALQAAAGGAGTSDAAGDADAVVAPGTPRGMEVAAHLAARLDVPMAANVVGVAEGGDALRVTRQVLGGGVLEEMELPERPAVLTVAGHAVAAQPGAPVDATLREFSPEVAETDLAARAVSIEPVEELDLSGALTSAKVVVGAGRGAGAETGFGDVVELAELLGGAVGVSRVVTSMGWRPHHEQIGQTGSRIAPDLYIPCGISGAIQHWAGCASSKTILAINSDEDAPMVTKATYAVIGDMHEILPAINAEIRRRRG